MYCVIAREVGSSQDLSAVTTYGPFVSELLASMFAKRRLQRAAWRVVPLLPDVSTDKMPAKLNRGSNHVKVSFLRK